MKETTGKYLKDDAHKYGSRRRTGLTSQREESKGTEIALRRVCDDLRVMKGEESAILLRSSQKREKKFHLSKRIPVLLPIRRGFWMR